jgi:hypothetical protein
MLLAINKEMSMLPTSTAQQMLRVGKNAGKMTLVGVVGLLPFHWCVWHSLRHKEA